MREEGEPTSVSVSVIRSERLEHRQWALPAAYRQHKRGGSRSLGWEASHMSPHGCYRHEMSDRDIFDTDHTTSIT